MNLIEEYELILITYVKMWESISYEMNDRYFYNYSRNLNIFSFLKNARHLSNLYDDFLIRLLNDFDNYISFKKYYNTNMNKP